MSKYHDTLQIKPGASKDEIKKAFRRLAVIHHPDKHGGDAKKFIEIKNAYDALMNDDKPIFGFDTSWTSSSGFWEPNPDAFYKFYEAVCTKDLFDLEVELRQKQHDVEILQQKIKMMKQEENTEDWLKRMRKQMGI